MGKKLSALRIVLICICFVWPVVYSINEFILKRFPEMLVPIPFCIAAAIPFIIALVLTFKIPREEYTAADCVLAAVLAVVAAAAAMFYFTLPGVLFGLLSAFCSFIMFIRTFKYRKLRIILIVVFGVLWAFLLFCFSVRLDRLDDELIASIPSPNGERFAEVVDEHDQFLGGLVSVIVYDKNDTFLGVMRYRKHDSSVWIEKRFSLMDESGVLRLPEVVWRDNRTLLINGEEYPIG